MDILKLLSFCAFFVIAYFFNVSPKRVLLTSVILLFLSLLLNALSNAKIILQLSTFFELYGWGSVVGLIFKKGYKEDFKQTRFAYFCFLAFIILQLIHNFLDIADLTNSELTQTLPTVNPWGMLMSFIVLFCYNSRTSISYIEEPLFIRFVVWGSYVYFFMMVLVQFGIIEGNTSKVFESAGGIGLLNRSTNETALIGVCFSIFLLEYTKNNNGSKLYINTAIVADIICIALTRSRVGIISIAVIFFLFFVNKAIRNPVRTIFITIILAAISFPIIETILSALDKRNKNDTGNETDFSTYSDKLGFTLSGRTLIWEAYIDQFFQLVGRSPQVLLFGGGFGSLITMYKRSFLPLIGFELKKVQFFPLHSDFLLIFITSGIAGLIIWLLLVFNIISDIVKRPNFIVAAFCWVLVAFTIFDMLNYSVFCSLLIGLGISRKQQIPQIYATSN